MQIGILSPVGTWHSRILLRHAYIKYAFHFYFLSLSCSWL